MAQTKPVGELCSAYLRKCRYPVARIDSWTSETRLLHDIGLFGDSVLDDFKILQDEFSVDLSGFEFNRYFPSELSTKAFLLTLRPLLLSRGCLRVRRGIWMPDSVKIGYKDAVDDVNLIKDANSLITLDLMFFSSSAVMLEKKLLISPCLVLKQRRENF